jgi:hypothetical protein
VVHVFALVLYIGIADDRKLVSDDMLFRKLETCTYFAKAIVGRWGYHSNPKDFGVVYCVPRLVDPDKARIY